MIARRVHLLRILEILATNMITTARVIYRSTASRKRILSSLSDLPFGGARVAESMISGCNNSETFVFPTNPSSLPSSSSFHTSSLTSFPVRRRRRSGNIPSDSDGEKTRGDGDDEADDGDGERSSRVSLLPSSVTDEEQFTEAANALLNKLYHALLPMKAVNDPFLLTRGLDDDQGPYLLLDLGPLHGQYQIQVDLEDKLVFLTSPISGQIAYVLSQTSGEWRSAEDGHSLEGILTRDLIRQCYGLPKL